jgi:hypothetical protein
VSRARRCGGDYLNEVVDERVLAFVEKYTDPLRMSRFTAVSVSHVDVIATVRGDAGRGFHGPRGQVGAGGREYLEAITVRIRHVHVAGAVHGHAGRAGQLPVAVARGAPLGEVGGCLLRGPGWKQRAGEDSGEGSGSNEETPLYSGLRG